MTDYKQLCAELLEAYEILLGELRFDNRLAKRAHAALAEPEPEGPTDEELLELYQGPGTFSAIEYARDVLARWGNHPGSPDSSTLQPVPVSERWPEFSDCDYAERVWCWSWAIGTWRLSRINQSIHSHWLPAHALPQPS